MFVFSILFLSFFLSFLPPCISCTTWSRDSVAGCSVLSGVYKLSAWKSWCNYSVREYSVLGPFCISRTESPGNHWRLCMMLILENGEQCSTAPPCRFIPGERTCGGHWRGGRVGPRVDRGDLEKEVSDGSHKKRWVPWPSDRLPAVYRDCALCC
jgi:hypothetical protein